MLQILIKKYKKDVSMKKYVILIIINSLNKVMINLE